MLGFLFTKLYPSSPTLVYIFLIIKFNHPFFLIRNMHSPSLNERDTEPLIFPSSPVAHNPNPHRIPSSKGNDQLENSVPSLLDCFCSGGFRRCERGRPGCSCLQFWQGPAQRIYQPDPQFQESWPKSYFFSIFTLYDCHTSQKRSRICRLADIWRDPSFCGSMH